MNLYAASCSSSIQHIRTHTHSLIHTHIHIRTTCHCCVVKRKNCSSARLIHHHSLLMNKNKITIKCAHHSYTHCVNIKSQKWMCVEACTCVFPSRTRPNHYYCLHCVCVCANCVALFQLVFCWMLFAIRNLFFFFSLRSQQSVRSRYSCERPSTERNDSKRRKNTHTFASDSETDRTEWLWLNLEKYYKTERNGTVNRINSNTNTMYNQIKSNQKLYWTYWKR